MALYYKRNDMLLYFSIIKFFVSTDSALNRAIVLWTATFYQFLNEKLHVRDF